MSNIQPLSVLLDKDVQKDLQQLQLVQLELIRMQIDKEFVELAQPDTYELLQLLLSPPVHVLLGNIVQLGLPLLLIVQVELITQCRRSLCFQSVLLVIQENIAQVLQKVQSQEPVLQGISVL